MKKQIIFSFILLSFISFKGFSQAAGFTMSGDAGCSPICTNFFNQTLNATSLLWDFGDASTSTTQNPIHCYTTPGNYVITLTATTPSGTSTATGSVNVYPNPISAFTSSNVPTNTVNFTYQSALAVTWSWNFGDATTNSTLPNPTHTYATAGNYTVSLLVVSSHACADSISSPIIANVIDVENASASWSIYPNPSNGQINIHFDNMLKDAEMISIENMLGEIILQKEISADESLDLSMQTAGIYFVRIGNSPAQKLVIE